MSQDKRAAAGASRGDIRPSDAYKEMPLEERASFRDQLRLAREECLRDAEAFDKVLFVLEGLGSRLSGKVKDLGEYMRFLNHVGLQSNLSTSSREHSGDGQRYFPDLLREIKDARNDAMHQGSIARHLTNLCVETALVLEDALGNELRSVELIMAKNPVSADAWRTLASIRQTMLANAYSYLPYHLDKWWLISDYKLAHHLLTSNDRKSELARQLQAVGHIETLATAAETITPDWSRTDAAKRLKDDRPLLVLRGGHLVGLVGPADLL